MPDLLFDQVEDKSLAFVIAGVSLAISAVLWLSVKPLPESANSEDDATEEPAASGGH